MKRLLLAGALALGSLATVATGALAADWTPPGPIKLLIAFKAGGGTDTQARLIAEELEKRQGWTIQPEQLTGKGGAVLAAAMKDMPNDGSVIGMLITDALTYSLEASKNPPYAVGDFTTLTTTAGFQIGIVARTEKGYTSWDDVVAEAKSGKEIRFGAMSPRLGDMAYLIGKHYGIDFNIVMVKGGKGVMNGLNAGDLDIGWGAGIQTKAVLAGDMVNLLSGLSKRLTASPDAPTLTEVGIDANADGYFLFAAPAGLPDDARVALSDAIAEIVEDQSTKAAQFVEKGYGGVVVIKREDLDAQIASEVAGARALIEAVSE
ncbi:MAG: tripartite tricarboxylate transporter substrate-binding protein [Pseudomonadota bacterium]